MLTNCFLFLGRGGVLKLFYLCVFLIFIFALHACIDCLTGRVFFELLQEASPSVVFIKDLEIVRSPKTTSDDVNLIEDENAKVDGTGSGFIWDNFGHIVSTPFLCSRI